MAARKTRRASSRHITSSSETYLHLLIYPSLHLTSRYNHTSNQHQHLHTFLLIFHHHHEVFPYQRSWITTESISTEKTLQHTKTYCTYNERARDSAPDYIQTEGKNSLNLFPLTVPGVIRAPRSWGWVMEGVKSSVALSSPAHALH